MYFTGKYLIRKLDMRLSLRSTVITLLRIIIILLRACLETKRAYVVPNRNRSSFFKNMDADESRNKTSLYELVNYQ